MSKSFSFKLALVLMLVVSIFLVAQQPATSSKTGKSKTDEATGKIVITSAQVAAITTEILQQVSEIRGLKLLRPVKSGAKSRAEIEQMVIKNFAEEATPEELDAQYKTLVAFGLVPKDFKYQEFLTKLLTEQIAGFYDPKKKELNLANWNALEMQKPVMAHELTHALQDQHFNLQQFDKWPKGDGDRELAIHALIEGDATALMIDYLVKPMGMNITKIPNQALNQMNEQTNQPGMEQFNAAPNAIREALIFPYSQGLLFAAEIIKAQGWDGVSKAYANLPQSTEQILHYGKYAINELPVKVVLADVSGVLGKGWKPIWKDVNGEFGYYLALAEYIEKVSARKAAEGWGGDQYVLYENAAKSKIVLAHLSAWDTKNDAADFFTAYAERTAKRWPKLTAQPNQAPTKYLYATPAGETLIEMRGKSILIIEGADEGGTEKLAAKLWESQVGEK